jgi:hypothetical protein
LSKNPALNFAAARHNPCHSVAGMRGAQAFERRAADVRTFWGEGMIKRAILFAGIGALALGACVLLSLAAGFAAARGDASSGVFRQDKGKFNIILNGQSVGREDFEIAPSDSRWIATGTTQLKLPDGKQVKVTGKLALQPDGTPVTYDWTSQTGKASGAHIDFSNGVAKITLAFQGAHSFQQDLTFASPLIAVLDNNLYYQYDVLARIYDWSKGGAQTFPVLIPQELTPGTITVRSTGSVTASGKSYEGLQVTTSDLEVQLFLDSEHRLMRLEVPSAQVSIVRE